jgi:hypothetical protein
MAGLGMEGGRVQAWVADIYPCIYVFIYLSVYLYMSLQTRCCWPISDQWFNMCLSLQRRAAHALDRLDPHCHQGVGEGLLHQR